MNGITSFFVTIFFCLTFSVHANADEILQLNYEGFTIWLDCERHGAVKFRYNVQRDVGNYKRHKEFSLDTNVPARCQQRSVGVYRHKGQQYDRGHLVPANHLDYSKKAIGQSNYMTNILPQAKNFNRGAYKHTEEITECYRDIDDLLIIGGVIWGNNRQNDFYLRSHGVATPDAFWKVIIRNERVIAWIIPNSQSATYDTLDRYIVSVDDIERVTGQLIPVKAYLKSERAATSWLIPFDCNKG